uniref:Proton-coupled folate transporter n=1 Tax=Timema shepardi TaxID=629360 RepID=A0A7R9FVU2_TIMSH|nr:unnamed protein product [Timema shepardi]
MNARDSLLITSEETTKRRQYDLDSGRLYKPSSQRLLKTRGFKVDKKKCVSGGLRKPTRDRDQERDAETNAGISGGIEAGYTDAKRFAVVQGRMPDYAVEPVMFFYMFAFMLTSVVEQAFFVNKACQVNLGYSQEICLDLTNDNFTEENKKVQVIVSNFHQNNNIASHVVPIVLALVIGSWSDRRGRKLPLIMGLIGKLFYSIMVIISSTQDTWPLETIILAASLPSALTGSDLAIFMAAFSYLSDITTPKDRTLRVSILDVVYLATMPTGIALGKYLFNLTDRSYTIMFSLNASMLLIAILYTIARLEWQTTPSQQPLDSSTNCCTDFFDKEHVIQSVKTVIKKRPHHRRAYLIILFVSMALYTFQRDEKPMSYLYTILKFKWTADEYSDYRTFQSTAYVIGKVFAVLSAADNAVPLFSATIYTQVYNATISTFPAAIFWVTGHPHLTRQQETRSRRNGMSSNRSGK